MKPIKQNLTRPRKSCLRLDPDRVEKAIQNSKRPGFNEKFVLPASKRTANHTLKP